VLAARRDARASPSDVIGPRVARPAGFPPSARLSDPEAFRKLLGVARKADGIVELAFRRRDEGSAKLGLVVSKRMLSRAVDRNRFRRIVRERFRLRRATLRAGEILIRLRRPVKNMADWPAQLRQSVDRLLTTVSK
jgi:ribonuclease P protein component